MSTATPDRKEFVLGLGIMYVHLRQIASVSLCSRGCGIVVSDELAKVVSVSWLYRHLAPRWQWPRLKSKQTPCLLRLTISGGSHLKKWSDEYSRHSGRRCWDLLDL